VAGAAEAAATFAYFVDFVPGDAHDGDENTLGDALAASDLHGLVAKIVDLNHQFVAITAVVLVDDADAVWDEQPFAARRAAAQREQQHVAERRLNDHVTGNEADGARGNLRILSANQVKADRTCRGIGGQRQAGIDALDCDLQILRGCIHIWYSKRERTLRQGELYSVPLRAKVIPIDLRLLLFVVSGSTAMVATSTIQASRQLQQQHALAVTGDVL
jgi:hypothetical protein